jgi:hypothetical protein
MKNDADRLADALYRAADRMPGPLDIEPVKARDRKWAGCGSCHERLAERPAVSIGRPSFNAPAVFVCLPCLEFAVFLARHPRAPRLRRKA